MANKSEQEPLQAVNLSNKPKTPKALSEKTVQEKDVLSGTEPQVFVLSDNRLGAIAQRKLAETMDNGGRMTAQQNHLTHIFNGVINQQPGTKEQAAFSSNNSKFPQTNEVQHPKPSRPQQTEKTVIQRQLRRCTGPEFEGLLCFEDTRAPKSLFTNIDEEPGWYFDYETNRKFFYVDSTRQYFISPNHYWDPVSKRIFQWNGVNYVDDLGAPYIYDGNYYQPIVVTAPLFPPAFPHDEAPANSNLPQASAQSSAPVSVAAAPEEKRNWIWDKNGYMLETNSGNIWLVKQPEGKRLVTRGFSPIKGRPDLEAEAMRAYEAAKPEIEKERQERKTKSLFLGSSERRAAPTAADHYTIEAKGSGIRGGTILKFYHKSTKKLLGQIHYYYDERGNFSFDLSKLSEEATGIGPYLIHEAIRRGGQDAGVVLIGTDDDGSGKLISFYQSLGFEQVSGPGGGMKGDPKEIMDACQLKFKR